MLPAEAPDRAAARSLPPRVILIGGIKRTGTSLMRNLIGSHSSIAIPPVEFGFFTDYRVADFDRPGGYARARERFLAGDRPQRWALKPNSVDENGSTARDFYCAVLEAFRRSVKPQASYYGDKSTFIEFRFDTYREWFGLERIRFVHMLRNPFDCYASTKSIPHQKKWRSYYLHDFCDRWARSAILGLTLAQRFPAAYRVVRYEDLVSSPEPLIADLCAWLGVPSETERMLAAADYERKSNSSFGDIPEKGDATHSSVVSLPAGSRLGRLTAEEIHTISEIGMPRLLPLLGYQLAAGLQSPSDTAAAAIRHSLNLAGARAGLPAYFRLIGVATKTMLSIVADRMRGTELSGPAQRRSSAQAGGGDTLRDE